MTSTTRTTGFYGTDSECYYLTPAGRVWAYASPDFDGMREIDALPEDATSLDGLITPEEAIDICRQIEAEGGEKLLESA